MRFFSVFSVFGLVLVACGSTNSNAPDASPDSTSPMDGGGKDATKDVASDAPRMETGPSDSGGDTSTDGPGETSTDGGACTMLAKKSDCEPCCRKLYPAGAKDLDTAELACACTTTESDAGTGATLCGPVDGGVPDAGEFGEGACSATCATTKAPSAGCAECLRAATGTMAKPGKCYATVEAACKADGGAECLSYVECVAGCK